MSLKIALVGRPNVGKSTFFNRLVGRKMAIVHDKPGVTRDRRYGDATLADLSFQIIDTAGLSDPDDSKTAEAMQNQTHAAIKEADMVLFMIDATVSCTPYDFELANQLRGIQKPVIIIINKIEGNRVFPGALDAHQFGFKEMVEISAEHGLGMDVLYETLKPYVKDYTEKAISKITPQDTFDDGEDDETTLNKLFSPEKPLKITVIGRPNVGKSTLINALLGEERMLTGDMPGLTRDAIRVPFSYKNHTMELVDTAGIRRTGKIHESLEHLSVNDSRKALQYAEVAILVIDATQAFEKQDLSLAHEIYNEGRAMVIALNKWDQVKDKPLFLKNIRHKLEFQLAQAKAIPFVGISALYKKNLNVLMSSIFKIYEIWNKRISTAKLNDWLQHAISLHPPPAIAGKRIRIKYMTQIKTRPPSFVLFCTKADQLPESYIRFLVNGMREAFDIPAVPIRISLKKTKNPYDKSSS